MKLTVSRFSAYPARLGEGATIANRFRLVRQIGEGGMGSVWLATHTGLGIPCALKFVEGEWRKQPEMVARFEREAKVEAQLRGPHVVHVFDHGVWNGTPYIAMELLQGESLATRLEQVGRLDAATTHTIVAHVARALTRAHAAGIVHRDLKPENIFLVPGDDGEVAKVLDFGVAKWNTDWAVSSVTKTGLLVGTPLYMSPEQARGTKDIDYRADLWSLAVIAFQCLTGELPFLSEGLGDLLAKIMFEPIPMPSTILPTLPPAIDDWWARASSRELASRFTSAKELADSLALALGLSGGVNVSAMPPGFREASLSDYSLSVSDGAIPHEHGPSHHVGLWPLTRGGKLLGVGVLGVIAIVSTMSFQMADKKSGQTLVSPSGAGITATIQPNPPPAPLPPTNPNPIPSVWADPTAPSSSDGAEETTDKTGVAQKPAERRPVAAPKPDKQRTKPSPPPKPKGVDFGI
ncbi:MAG TPA: serine/threonine-protein kinase [Polyangiaceae bacterium]